MLLTRTSRLRNEEWLARRKLSSACYGVLAGMTCVGMPCDVEERPQATIGRLTSASSCGGAHGDLCKLPRSIPRATVILNWWARWCCLTWLMDILWTIFDELPAPHVWPAAMFADESIQVVQLVADVGMAPDMRSNSKRTVLESCGGGSSQQDATLSSSPGDDISESIRHYRREVPNGTRDALMGNMAAPSARKSSKLGPRNRGRPGVGEHERQPHLALGVAHRPARKWKVPALGIPVPVNNDLESGKELGMGSGARRDPAAVGERCPSASPRRR